MTRNTSSLCLSDRVTGRPVATSQILAVPSAEDVASREPSGLNATQITVSL